jgi:hypothetical protein
MNEDQKTAVPASPPERFVRNFKVGRYYKHPGGKVIHIVGAVRTTMYGWTLVAEEGGSSNLLPIGQDTDSAANWTETTEEHWMSGFFNGGSK